MTTMRQRPSPLTLYRRDLTAAEMIAYPYCESDHCARRATEAIQLATADGTRLLRTLRVCSQCQASLPVALFVHHAPDPD